MRLSQYPVTVVLALAGGTPALANDSTASFATGGLVLTRTDAIAMRSEDLSVSADAIHVAYVFRNTSDRLVTTTVAFPVPDVTALPYIDISIPNDDPANPLGFETRVEGKPVTMALDQKATLAGRDVTSLLTGLGVPLAPQDERAGEALDALPRARQDELIAAGLAEPGDPEAADSRDRNLQALWSWSGTYHWE